jgi:hypothetical protein
MTESKNAVALVPANFSEGQAMAKFYASSKLVPQELRDKPADVYVAMTQGLELGVGPATSLRHINVIQGKPEIDAVLAHGLVLASPLCEYFRLVSVDEKQATYETKRVGDPPKSMQFTMEEARRAKLVDRGKDPSDNNWNKWPKRMMQAACKRQLASDVYPDILTGLAVNLEIEEGVSYNDGEPSDEAIADAELVNAETGEVEDAVLAATAEVIEKYKSRITALDNIDDMVKLKDQELKKEAPTVVNAVREHWLARRDQIFKARDAANFDG